MKVVFYEASSGRSPIEDFIRDLSKKDKARVIDVIKGLEQYGLDCPRVIFKPLRGKLWEIKFNSTEGSYRIAYVIIAKDSMVWLHVFKKKTQKTQISDIELAEKRMKEVL